MAADGDAMSASRNLAAVTVSFALAFTTAAPALAHPGEAQGKSAEARARKDKQNKSAEARARKENKDKQHKSAEARARKNTRFVATGIVQAVSGSTITLNVKGGAPKAVRGENRTFNVAEGATVKRNGEDVALSAIQAGDHAMVKGARQGDTLVASKVRAQSREEAPAEPGS